MATEMRPSGPHTMSISLPRPARAVPRLPVALTAPPGRGAVLVGVVVAIAAFFPAASAALRFTTVRT